METEHLRELAVLADVRSFTLAARELNMTQSTLSKHVAALEREFGVALFERTGKGVEPTQAGAVLCEKAREVCRLVADARASVRSVAEGSSVGAKATPFEERPRMDVRLRRRVPRLASRYGFDREEAGALVLFLEERPISDIARELGMPRDAAADVLARAYRKLGAHDKESARRLAYSDAE